MTAARAAGGQLPGPRLPAKPAAHPPVPAVLARREAGDVVHPAPVIDAAWLRELCLAAGADDAAAVSLDHPDLAGERVLPRSPAQECARRRFPHKPVKEVTGGWQPPAKRSASPDRETRTS